MRVRIENENEVRKTFASITNKAADSFQETDCTPQASHLIR